MGRISTYIQTIRSSFYNPIFYSTLREKTLGNIVKVFVPLALFGTVVIAIQLLIGVTALTQMPILDSLESAYPDTLVITAAHGAVTINQPQPYYVKNTFGIGGPKYLVIFDGNDTLSGDLAQNSTFVIVKKTFLISGSETDSRMTSFSNIVATSTLTKSNVVTFIEKVRPYFAPGIIAGASVLALLIVILGSLFWILFHMIYLLLPAFVIFLLSRIGTSKFAFAQSYAIVAFASIPVVIVSYLLHFIGMSFLAFEYTALVLLIAALNLIPSASKPKIEGQ